MSKNFTEVRKGLKQDLFALAELAEDAVQSSLMSIVGSDENLALAVISEDREIHQMQLAMEKQCHNWLEIFHPEGEDLRFLCASLRIAHDLERIGDLAVDVAQHARQLIARQRNFSDLPPLAELSEKAEELLHDTVEMLLHQEPQRAQDIAEQDQRIDGNLFRAITHVVEKISREPDLAPHLVHSLLIARDLERISDLSVAIAEGVVFSATGKRLPSRQVSSSPLSETPVPPG